MPHEKPPKINYPYKYTQHGESGKPMNKSEVSAIKRGVHPKIPLGVVQKNMLKKLGGIHFLHKKFLNGKHRIFNWRIKRALAKHLKVPGKKLDFGLLITEHKNRRKENILGFRKTILIPSKTSGEVEVLEIIGGKKLRDEISFEEVDEKERFYIITSAIETASFPHKSF